jgi:hypothetical protein
VFENRVLRRTEEPKIVEVAGGCRRYNEELRNSYTTQNSIRVIKSKSMSKAEHAVSMGEIRNTYKILVGKPETERPCGRPRRRWKDNT